MEETALTHDPFQRDEPRSLVNIVPPGMASKLFSAYQAHPEWFGIDEHQLKKVLRTESCLPNPTDNRLRMKFWMEYDLAQSEMRNVNMRAVVAGVCSIQYFNERYLNDPAKVAWLLAPPANYLVVVEEALQVGLETLRGILEQNPASGGKIDTKLGELQLKIVAMLDQRVKGAVVQRTMNLHASVPKGAVAEISQEKSMEALEKRMKLIESRRRQAQGAIIDHPAVSIEQEKPDS